MTGKLDGQNYHGTGCLISSRIVLTCAHNIFDRTTGKEGTCLNFIPVINGGEGGRKMKVKKAYYPEEYAEK